VFEGFAGFTVTMDLIEDGDVNWIKLTGTPPTEAPAAEAQTDWTQAIAELNARAEGWVYQLPGYEVAGIKKRMDDFVREPEDSGV